MEEGQRLLERILDGAEDPTDLPLALLKRITNDFSEENIIGQGGFGAVYKGVFGERVVAVKRIHINENTFDDRLFRREFVSLWNTNHRNVVRFLGFCSNTYQKTIQDAGSGEVRLASVLERLLCFEYISNGSLDKHITDELRGLEWETRYEIITRICKGLRYLHKEKNIIHMDLKPENILLHHQDDKYIVPKITDFGLSRLSENSHTVGTRFGTRGYMAPEYEKYGKTTFMSDIYSLGAIIIELVTGSKDVPNEDNVLRRWRHRWNKPPTQLQYQQVIRCIHIAGRCRGENPESRPSIKEIISFLSESESTYSQIIPLLDEDDMLGIKPLELRLPSEFNQSIECSVELTNGTSKCIAFNIQLPNPERYGAHPVKGIMQPGSKYDVKITVQTRDVHRRDHDVKIKVQSMKASEGLTEEEITKLMSGVEAHKVVDEVDLMMLYETTKSQEKSKHREETNMPAEEVHEAKKRNIDESAFGKGKNKLGSSKNADGTSLANTGSDNHIQNVHTNNISKRTTSDPTDEVTGREDAIKKIREMLRQTEDPKRLSVIGIIGIPGSGKTTLAQCVCKSERSDSYFDLVMWIYVSQNFTVETIYGEMFEQAWKKFGGTLKIPKYSGLEALKEELKKVLTGKLFLFIMDDIWFGNEQDTASDDTDEKLKEILIPLVDGKRESKILVTSRQDSLLRLGRTVKSTTYKIPDLDDAVFLKLFMQYAFDENRVKQEDERRIRKIGAEIAVKLKKSPLLARVVGSSLFRKRIIEVADWRIVRDQNLTDQDMGALWWSYQHLGEQARRCFAYCSIFPRRYRLRRVELVNLWVAEGFIDSTNIGHKMEYVGRGYFDELLSSSFLLPGGKDDDGKEYFSIHDLLYDLAVKVAGDGCFKIGNSWTSEVPLNVRHLSIQSCTPSMVTEHIGKLKKLRTLMIFKFAEDYFSMYDLPKFEDDKGFDNMFRQLSELRVLIFGTATRIPKSIGYLKYLRYLGVQEEWIQQITLPDTVEKLYLLQVLDLGNSWIVHSSFSEDLIKLADLRHVYIKNGKCFPNMGRLTSLRTMPRLDVSEGEGHELYQLEHLNNLEGKLIIDGLQCVKSKDEAVNAKLAQKELLTELELSWYDVEHDMLWYEVEREDYNRDLEAEVLEALCPPKNITDLTINYYFCSRYPTWMVGTEESTIQLSTLVLCACPRPVCGPGDFFIRVSTLELEDCRWDTLPDMKHLSSLELHDCFMPSSLENLTSLERLIIRCYDFTVPILPRSLLYIDIDDYNCNERENQILEKVKHIPRIVLSGMEFKVLDVSGGEGNELCQLEHLNTLQGKLIIHGLHCVKTKDEALNAKLAQKELLTELELSWFDGEGRDYIRDLQAEVLEALCPPENITDLTINSYFCTRYPTWMVGTKETTIELSELVLVHCPRPVCYPGYFFIRVSSLVMEFCEWETLPDMKHLTSLELDSCSMPSSLEILTSLEMLIIHDCGNFTVPILPRSLRYIHIHACICNESEDQFFDKVKHIPHILEYENEFIDGVNDEEEDYEGFDKQDDQAAAAEEEYYSETHRKKQKIYCNVQDEEGASQVNGSQTSAQVEDNTRQLFQFSEAPGCSSQDRAEPMANFQAPNQQNDGEFQEVNDLITVAEEIELPFTRLLPFTEERQSGHTQDLVVWESLHLPSSSLVAPSLSSLNLTLAVCSSPDRAEPVDNFPVDTDNILFVQPGSNVILVNAVSQNLNHIFPPGELVDPPNQFNGGNCCYIEDGKAASRMNGSQTSAQVQNKTRKLVQLIEEQQDYDRMSINNDVPLLVDTSLRLAIGWDGQQSWHIQDLESLQLPLTGMLASSPSSIHLTPALGSSPDTATPDGVVDLSQAPNQLNHEEFLELSEDDETTSINCSRQLIQLIEEAQKDSGGMSNDTDVPPLVDTSLQLAVGLEVRQNGNSAILESLQLQFTLPLAPSSPSSLDLTLALAPPPHGCPPPPPCSSLGRAKPMANFPVDVDNDIFVQRCNDGILVNAVGKYLEAPIGGLVGIGASFSVTQPQAEAVDDDPSEYAFWDNLLTDSEEGAEDNDDDTCQAAFWDNLLADSDEEGEEAAGQA